MTPEFTLCTETEKGFRFYNHKSQDFDLPDFDLAARFKTIEAARSEAFNLITPERYRIFVHSDVDGIVNTVG